MADETKAPALPSWPDVKAYYLRRWKFANLLVGHLLKTLLRNNASRIFLAVITLAAIIVGAVKFDVGPILWPIAVVLVGFALSVLWVWIASPWAVVRDLIAEVQRLNDLVARQAVDKAAGEKLEEFFFEGFDLMQGNQFENQRQMLDWGDLYTDWRNRVAEFLRGISREEQFMFLSAGFEYDVEIFRDLRGAEETARAVGMALPAKMLKLRRITGRIFKSSETDVPPGQRR